MFGAAPDDIARLMVQMGDEESEFEVWPMNVRIVRVFRGLATQWRIGPMGEAIGLDYSALTPAVIRGFRVPMAEWPAVFDGVRVMEAAAVRVFSERAARNAATAKRRRR